MKKIIRLLPGIIVIMIILFFVYVLGLFKGLNPFFNKFVAGTPDKTCQTDNDCVIRKTGCHPCDCGDAVNKKWHKFCPFMDPTLYQCGPCAMTAAKCQNHTCQMIITDPNINVNTNFNSNLNAQTNANVNKNYNINASDKPLPDISACEYQEFGWQCLIKADYFSDEWKNLNNTFQKTCEDQGGKWHCYGMCAADHICDFPFNDAGKKCKNTSECQGKCVVSKDFVETNYPNRILLKDFSVNASVEGTCAQYPLRECDWHFVLNNGVIEDHTGVLCD